MTWTDIMIYYVETNMGACMCIRSAFVLDMFGTSGIIYILGIYDIVQQLELKIKEV